MGGHPPASLIYGLESNELTLSRTNSCRPQLTRMLRKLEGCLVSATAVWAATWDGEGGGRSEREG